MKQPLTLYALRKSIQRADEALRPEVLAAPVLQRFVLSPALTFEADLFAMPVEATEPAWAKFLREGFPDFEATPSAMSRVALILRVASNGEQSFFAATFGSGRFLLREGATEKKYGLLVALNAIYEGDRSDQLVPIERIRQVGMTRVGKNTMQTRRQSNRNAAFQDFGVDLDSDLFGMIVGVPGDATKWGSRLSGSDSLRIQTIDRFEQLGALCTSLIDAHSRDDYRVRFHQIDDLRSLEPEEELDLQPRILELVRKSPDRVSLAPPDLLDFDRVSTFRFSVAPKVTFEELRLSDYLSLLEKADEELTLDRLQRDTVEALDDQYEVIESWSVWKTLDTEIKTQKSTVLLVGGEFYEISLDLMEALNQFVDDIQESQVVLPPSKREVARTTESGKTKISEETEGEYNQRAADSSKEFLCLDKLTVRAQSNADPIEVCDILTTQRQFVHVKRKFSSSSLSHLFGQGAVSGELFVRDAAFREAVRRQIKEPGPNAPPDPEPFLRLILEARPEAARFEVVYAVIGEWGGGKPSEKLPFFSKLNLRRHTNDLRALGYNVTLKKIELE